MSTERLKTNFLIAGSGVAGLQAAYQASRYGSVVLVTKSDLSASSSYWAQGGIAAVLDKPDSFLNHINDTLQAGRGYCNTDAVDILVKEGSQRVKELIELGMPFDKSGESFDLGLEGGHSERRILHVDGAATGKALIDFYIQLVENKPEITIIEHAFVYNLIIDKNTNVCYGTDVYLYEEHRQLRIESDTTILATGGYSGLYSRTTNPHTSTGDGLWLAHNHGAVLKDLEFVQFHPTAFYTKTGDAFLISEALRGEGARLYNSAGERFMMNYKQKELAPRDVVAKQIFREIQASTNEFVHLDVRHLNTDHLKVKYPALIQKIEEQGIDITREGIPVTPAAHYCIGGIETDLNGKTAVNKLYACGEVAATGVHGANRLASNSLLECLVFGKKAAEHASKQIPGVSNYDVPFTELKINHLNSDVFTKIKSGLADIFNNFIGIERNEQNLKKAIKQIELFDNQLKNPDENEYYAIRINGMLKLSKRIALAALNRKESRGVHTRSDQNNSH